ncbi:hypothetical protein SADUNF_Sadunf07G0060200 [Salix dunnii]|uniref:Uncharacterized protein n=1 Tax=Salix dunnii TaxID=1413687 RepID=A0A835MV93_9ROSI|nr:hypothetical protein SADUNF_Sadunf07G0060200 [Salix dunnii]
MDGLMDEIREVLDHCDPAWNPSDAVDFHGQTLLHILKKTRQERPKAMEEMIVLGRNNMPAPFSRYLSAGI